MPPTELHFLRTGVRIDHRADGLPAAAALAQPVLFLAGEIDPIAPPSDSQALLASTSHPRSKAVILAGADHGTYRGAPDLYEQGFCRSCRTSLSLRPHDDSRLSWAALPGS
jgi:pimeloyl-ACP methyl ester carboxylesterase